MPDSLPTFKYHPNPLASGSIVKSDGVCVCCNQSRGYIYTGPVYAEGEYDNCLCPWCIADGSAAEKFDACFVDEEGIGGYGDWDDVPEVVIDEVAHRTPGFTAWQQEKWWTHCGDAGQFLGLADREALEKAGDQAVTAIRESTDIDDDDEWKEFLDALSKDGSPTAYLFRCGKCGKYGGYVDCD